MDTHSFPTSHFLSFLFHQHCSVRRKSVNTVASRGVAALVLVQGGHDEQIQSAALVVVVVVYEVQGRIKTRSRVTMTRMEVVMRRLLADLFVCVLE